MADRKHSTLVRQMVQSDTQIIQALSEEADMGELSTYENTTVAVDIDTNKILGFARIVSYDNIYYLSPLVVDRTARGMGIGSLLIQSVVRSFGQLLLVARGSACDFYYENGGQDVSWDIIAPEVKLECLECKKREDCNPQPMLLL